VKTILKGALVALVALIAVQAAACTPRPQAKLVAVSGAHAVDHTTTVMVLVEIHNPTDEMLMLSGLDYEVKADGWFTARGSYGLARFLVPGDTSIIEVPLPVKNFDLALGAPAAAFEGVKFHLDGRLRALRPKGGELEWKVTQDGALSPVVKVRHHHRGRPTRQQIKVRVDAST